VGVCDFGFKKEERLQRKKRVQTPLNQYRSVIKTPPEEKKYGII
jgi:hypothetical protein